MPDLNGMIWPQKGHVYSGRNPKKITRVTSRDSTPDLSTLGCFLDPAARPVVQGFGLEAQLPG